MGTTSSRPPPPPAPSQYSSNKSKRKTYDYVHQFPPGYWPQPQQYPYNYHQQQQPVANWGPVIPPPPPQQQQYPSTNYYHQHTIQMPQPFIPPPLPQQQQQQQQQQHQPVIPRPPPQPAMQPQQPASTVQQPAATNNNNNNKPVIPPPLPPQQQRKSERPQQKRKSTRKKKKITFVATFKPPDEPDAPGDLSRSLSNAHDSSTANSAAAAITTEDRPPNPLPPLPINVYETSPYKHLLQPMELPDLSMLEPGNTFVVEEVEVPVPVEPPQQPQQQQQQKQQGRKGLFSGMKRKPPPPLVEPQPQPQLQRTQTQTRFVLLPGPVSASTFSDPTPTSAPISSAPLTGTTDVPLTGGTSITPGSAHTSPQPHSDPHPPHSPTIPTIPTTPTTSSPPPIYFNQSTPYSGFLNHSPYTVSYERTTYPTATHLIEAMKFLPETEENKGVAEMIRRCGDMFDLYSISNEFREVGSRSGEGEEESGEEYLDMMEQIMYYKFHQHSDLSDLLLSTGNAQLIYNDPSDSFWGVGGANGVPGQNELGNLLERVRERVRVDRMR